MADISIRKFNSLVRAKAFILNGVKALTSATFTASKQHAGRTTVISDVDGGTITLPASSGSGLKFRFVLGSTLTSGTFVVKVANATDVFVGGVIINDIGDTTVATADFHPTAATSDTFTMTQSIGGGKQGDWVEFEDIKSGFWAVNGVMQGVTDPTSPFSATVS